MIRSLRRKGSLRPERFDDRVGVESSVKWPSTAGLDLRIFPKDEGVELGYARSCNERHVTREGDPNSDSITIDLALEMRGRSRAGHQRRLIGSARRPANADAAGHVSAHD